MSAHSGQSTCGQSIKVLVVDDTSIMRRAITQILEADPTITVVDTASNGLEALEKIHHHKPDVVTMDIDMPVMNGLSAIRHIMIKSPVPIVAFSSLTTDGYAVFEALRLGVVDFVPKPMGGIFHDVEQSKEHIINRIKVACSMRLDRVRRVRLPKKWNTKERIEKLYRYYPLEYIVVIGTTLSGPNTVIRLLTNLSPMIPAAVVVVQEISPRIIDSFVDRFNDHVAWKIKAGKHGIEIEQGTCYICSNENSVRLGVSSKGDICLNIEKKISNPLDEFFSSAAEIFHQNTIGILLSGIGDDGAEGFNQIKMKNGVTMVKDSQLCVFPNLTDNAIQKGVVDLILDDIQLSSAIESVMK